MASPPPKRVIPFPSPGTADTFVLSVDDEPDILATRREILLKAGYRVLNAANRDDALKFFNSQFVDLVLLDHRLPGIDGGEIAREMKRRRPMVPIIIVSGYLNDLKSVASADCYVIKGGSPAQLLQLMAGVLAPAQEA